MVHDVDKELVDVEIRRVRVRYLPRPDLPRVHHLQEDPDERTVRQVRSSCGLHQADAVAVRVGLRVHGEVAAFLEAKALFARDPQRPLAVAPFHLREEAHGLLGRRTGCGVGGWGQRRRAEHRRRLRHQATAENRIAARILRWVTTESPCSEGALVAASAIGGSTRSNGVKGTAGVKPQDTGAVHYAGRKCCLAFQRPGDPCFGRVGAGQRGTRRPRRRHPQMLPLKGVSHAGKDKLCIHAHRASHRCRHYRHPRGDCRAQFPRGADAQQDLALPRGYADPCHRDRGLLGGLQCVPAVGPAQQHFRGRMPATATAGSGATRRALPRSPRPCLT